MISEILIPISLLTSYVLIIGGIFSSVYFLERISMVFSEELGEWLKFISYFGFLIGLIVLIVTATNLVVPHLDPAELGKQTGWDVTILGFILGVTLCLRPIKDYQWAAIITLTLGCIIMIIIWLFASSSVSLILIGFIIAFLFMFYMSLKFVEDIYSLLGNILTAPPLAVGIGILSVIQGVLLFFGSSFISLLGL